jgi:hypothetical protein
MRHTAALALALVLGWTGIAAPPAIPKAPVEAAGFSRLTRHEEQTTFLEKLAMTAGWEMEVPACSIEGREIPVLFLSAGPFGSNRDRKPVVLVFATQHGNEPAGREATLMALARWAAARPAFLERLDLIVVPCLNPDGAERSQRRNAAGVDLNRDHVLLSAGETRLLHGLFRRWMPEVTLDLHEYNALSEAWIRAGFVRNADTMLGGVTNLNIDPGIRAFSESVFIPDVGRRVAEAGFTFHEYVVGAPFEGDRLRRSTVGINDGRQSFGVYNTLACIVEGRRFGEPDNQLERRARAQLATLEAFLAATAAHAPEILAAVRRARAAGAGMPPRVAVQMEHYADPNRPVLPFPVFNLLTWRPEIRDLPRWEPVVRVRRSVTRPWGYAVSGTESALIVLLERHGLAAHVLEEVTPISAERYRVLHATRRVEEELDLPDLAVEKETVTVELQPGDRLYPMDQPGGLLLALMLEPESSWGVVAEEGAAAAPFRKYAAEDSIFPVLRLAAPPEPADPPGGGSAKRR